MFLICLFKAIAYLKQLPVVEQDSTRSTILVKTNWPETRIADCSFNGWSLQFKLSLNEQQQQATVAITATELSMYFGLVCDVWCAEVGYSSIYIYFF